jgi:hypothetical protein
MAYFCLSFVQQIAGGRKRVGAIYQAEHEVLDTLGKLTSEVGDAQTARKFDAYSTRRALGSKEKAWIEAVIPALIIRVGEYAPDRTLPLLTMKDFPPL